MKVFLSCDMEGTSGISDWDETEKKNAEYAPYVQRMQQEVAAACEGINQAHPGSEIVIKDAHDSTRNLDHALLPRNVTLIRGWGASPYSMMFGIDRTFDAAVFTGYHCGAGYAGNPLAHTMNLTVHKLWINGTLGSEFLINYYAALYNGVPVTLVTGDAALCHSVTEIDPEICTVPTNTCLGSTVRAEHPAVIQERIKATAAESLSRIGKVSMELPDIFESEVCFRSHINAVKASFYPGANIIDAYTVGYSTEDYFEFLRFFMFTVG
uniref:Putative amino acid amidase n=1 Tax=uncultured bacterium contig00107 TaxID=1181573 RepID=A0A806KHR1_9BACT|nr:putative amino acid amidase [uncultured bacterium contig00107]